MPELFLTRRQLFLHKVETTYGVDAAPSANSYEAVRLVDPFQLDLNQDFIENNAGNLSRGRGRPIPGIKRQGVTIRTFVQGITTTSYGASVKPPIGALLRACGLQETFIASGPLFGTPEYRYAPTATVASDTSITIVAHQDGYEHRLTGCRGNVNLIWSADAPVIAEFNFRGLLGTEAATVRSAPTGLPTATPPQWVDSGSIFINSYQIPVENLNFNTNNTVFEEPGSVAKSATGVIAVVITERAPGGSFDPEATHPSTVDFFQMWRAASGSILKLQAGLNQGGRVTLVASQVVPRRIGWGDKQGLAIFNNDFEAVEGTTNDDQFVISFT